MKIKTEEFKKCRKCDCEDLTLIEDYEYLNEDDKIEIMDVYECNSCGCIHHRSEFASFYQFWCKNQEEHNAARDYATDFSIAVSKN